MATNYSPVKSLFILVGRLCFSLIFIVAGFDKVFNFGEYFGMMVSKGVPYAETMLILAIIFELGGGLLVFFGLFTRFGAFLLFIFIIPVTFYFHPFWTMEGSEMVNNVHHLLKNLSLLGATLYIMAVGAGCYSIDGLFHKKFGKEKSTIQT